MCNLDWHQFQFVIQCAWLTFLRCKFVSDKWWSHIKQIIHKIMWRNWIKLNSLLRIFEFLRSWFCTDLFSWKSLNIPSWEKNNNWGVALHSNPLYLQTLQTVYLITITDKDELIGLSVKFISRSMWRIHQFYVTTNCDETSCKKSESFFLWLCHVYFWIFVLL